MSNFKKKKNPLSVIDFKRIGRIIKTRRKELHISQENLAINVGCSTTHISRVEGGAKISLELLYRLGLALHISFDELLAGSAIPGTDSFRVQSIMSQSSHPEQAMYAQVLNILYQYLREMEYRGLYNLYRNYSRQKELEEEHEMLYSITSYPASGTTPPWFTEQSEVAETPAAYDFSKQSNHWIKSSLDEEEDLRKKLIEKKIGQRKKTKKDSGKTISPDNPGDEQI